MNTPHLLIRADAGGSLGTGHVMRMIALAQAWQDRGGSVTLAACQCPPALTARLKDERIDFAPFGDHPMGEATELAETIQLGKSLKTPWIVIDGYHFTAGYQKTLKENGFKVLAVDDFGHGEKWHADLVLNQNIQNPIPGESLSPSDQPNTLLGTQYALLRREFRNASSRIVRQHPNSQRILVTFGGVDPVGATLKVLKSLNRLPELPFELKVLAGPANPRLDALHFEAKKSPHPIEIIPSTRDMPSLYRWADRVISAGGSSCYEWMFFDVPGWVTSIAENQHRIVEAILNQNLAAGHPKIAEAGTDQLTDSIGNWLKRTDPPRSTIVDGFGALRVAAAISETQCWVRPIIPDIDARFLFELANHESVRTAGRHTKKIEWNEHIAWLQRHSTSEHSRLMIIETLAHGQAGQIRFHEIEPNMWEIGISIHPDFRKARLATTSLSIAMMALLAEREVIQWKAEIRNSNLASQGLFSKFGFHRTGEREDLQTWIRAHPTATF